MGKEENKKRILIILAGIIVVLALVIGIVAICNKSTNDNSTKTVEATGLEYELSSDGTYYIVKGIGTEKTTNFSIPATYEGKPVKEIKDRAFNVSKIKSITIGNNITAIGGYAFMGCGDLETINIGDKVSSIGEGAFLCTSIGEINKITVQGVSKLKNIVVSQNNETYKSVNGNLYSKDGLTLVQYAIGKTNETFEIPSDVTTIGVYAFALCDSLKTITIPDNVTTIGAYAFNACGNLTEVIIGNGVTSIGEIAFNNCSDLTSFTLGANVSSIDSNAFGGCKTLVEIINYSGLSLTKGSEEYGNIAKCALNIKTSGASDIENVDDYLFYTYDSKNYLISYKGNETELTLPNYYNGASYEIYKFAFSNGRGIKSVKIPLGVTSIGSSAFEHCYDLESVEIEENVTTINDSAFKSCISLKTVTIGIGVITIEDYAFSACSALTTINYKGTKAEWETIEIDTYWDNDTAEYIIHCTDGNITK